jgi:hypothetical protein
MSDADLRTDESETVEGDASDRVHHHARIGDEHPQGADGSFTTLCGLRITPRPEAARLPCCPMCALVMGRPCR